MIKITFPDGSVREYAEGTTPLQIAESISPRFAADVLAAKINGEEWDLARPVQGDARIELFKWDDPEGKHAFWHSSAHLLAEALQELYPGVKFGIGPAIENGFYYDIDPGEHKITDEDFPKIEKKMLELAAQKQPIVRADISKEDALKMFGDRGEEYKCELISELEDGHITTYTQGNFTDLCRGPHIPTTAPIKAAKIMSLAGAYWRGDETRNQLVRVYGITFPKKKMLDEYMVLLEEAKKRDHRILGRDMELFAFSPMVGQGLPLWLPKGAALRDRLEQFLRKIQKKYGYLQVITPHIGNKALYVTSGHWAKYGKDAPGRRGVSAEADELPAPLRDLQDIAPLIPRPAAALRRVRYRLPLRAERRAARTDTCARIHAGRRSPVRDARPDQGGVPEGDGHHPVHIPCP